MSSSVRTALAATALLLGMSSAFQAAADVMYRFSLEANGAVGPVQITYTTPNFIPVGGLNVFSLTDPRISFTSGTTLDPAGSVIGLDQDATETLYGISLTNAADTVLFTVGYPADFFRFTRDFDDEGVFTSTAGLVASDLNLATRAPVATLCVSSTGACDAVVPEPGSLALIGLGLSLLGLGRRARCTS